MNQQNVIDNYITGLTPEAARVAKSVITSFEKNVCQNWQEVTEEEFLEFLAALSVTTRKAYAAIIKRLYKLALQANVVHQTHFDIVADCIDYSDETTPLPKVLTTALLEQIGQISYQAIKDSDVKIARDATLFLVAGVLGLRKSELQNLSYSLFYNLTTTLGSVRQKRTIPIVRLVQDRLNLWVMLRNQYFFTTNYLFPNLQSMREDTPYKVTAKLSTLTTYGVPEIPITDFYRWFYYQLDTIDLPVVDAIKANRIYWKEEEKKPVHDVYQLIAQKVLK